ncbi:glutathione S-transferase family protein [Novosphingobium sp. Rr 2-17]|uniref:glutathione S-transferase family protein n=1 Tax=Novosphingobium sp. Rr 2-17 TaxID=555793 RepID=UPI0012F6F9CE|nr:hypothetical protein [Novosphingobium sp. Rr 2-17]
MQCVEIDEVFVSKGSADPVFRAASPAGIIPALRDRDFAVCGPYAILEVLDAEKKLIFPESPYAKAEVLSVAQLADGPLARAVSVVFQNSIYLPRFRGKAGNPKLARQVVQGSIPEVLSHLEHAVQRMPVGLTNVSVASLSIFSQCITLAMSGFGVDGISYPGLWRLLEGMLDDVRLVPIIERDARLFGSSFAEIRAAMQSAEMEIAG